PTSRPSNRRRLRVRRGHRLRARVRPPHGTHGPVPVLIDVHAHGGIGTDVTDPVPVARSEHPRTPGPHHVCLRHHAGRPVPVDRFYEFPADHGESTRGGTVVVHNGGLAGQPGQQPHPVSTHGVDQDGEPFVRVVTQQRAPT